MVITPGKGICLPGSDSSAFVDQPEEFHGAEVVETFSFSLPVYGAVPLSFALSPRVYKKIKYVVVCCCCWLVCIYVH